MKKPRGRAPRERKKQVTPLFPNKPRAGIKQKVVREQLLRKAIRFKGKDGSRIMLLRQAFANIYRDIPGAKSRPLIIVIVDNQWMLFYKSSGENSKMPGAWFPTEGPRLYTFPWGESSLGGLTKFPGHPLDNHPPRFKPWVQEISQRIAKAEQRGEIQFQTQWGTNTYKMLKETFFSTIPMTNKKTGEQHGTKA